MEIRPKRPIVIWLVLAYLAILVAGNFYVTVKLTTFLLNSGSDGAINLFISVGFAALMIWAMTGVFKKAPWGRRFAVLCFVLLGFVNFFRLSSLLNWPDNADKTNAVRLVLAQLVLSFVFAAVFGFSKTAQHYFRPSTELYSPPPPPPSFDT